jgi:hypothetical protein
VRDGNIVTCDSWFAGVDGALEVVSFLCGAAEAERVAASNLYDWRRSELDSSHPPGEATPPSHQIAILHTVLEHGADAALAEYQTWLMKRRNEPTPFDRGRDRFGFHILGWTLEGAGRVDDAAALCEWTAAAFPDSALALACLGEAYYLQGRFEEALATLIAADAKEHGEPRALRFLAAVLHHPEHVANADSQRARRILREHPSIGVAELVPAAEPGERMVIRGTVRDASGRPIPGALVYVFHADTNGNYTPTAAMDEPDARLFAFVRTDESGCYEFTTVRPGGYAKPRSDVPADAQNDVRWIPQHVHYEGRLQAMRRAASSSCFATTRA